GFRADRGPGPRSERNGVLVIHPGAAAKRQAVIRLDIGKVAHGCTANHPSTVDFRFHHGTVADGSRILRVGTDLGSLSQGAGTCRIIANSCVFAESRRIVGAIPDRTVMAHGGAMGRTVADPRIIAYGNRVGRAVAYMRGSSHGGAVG